MKIYKLLFWASSKIISLFFSSLAEDFTQETLAVSWNIPRLILSYFERS